MMNKTEYYCPKSCELQGDKCSWKVKPKVSSEPESANYLNYCPFYMTHLNLNPPMTTESLREQIIHALALPPVTGRTKEYAGTVNFSKLADQILALVIKDIERIKE
jgi:hypothetical protein